MKISIIFKVLLFINTTALFVLIINKLIEGFNIWGLVLIEAILLISYYHKSVIKEVRNASNIDTRNLSVFSRKNKRSA